MKRKLQSGFISKRKDIPSGGKDKIDAVQFF